MSTYSLCLCTPYIWRYSEKGKLSTWLIKTHNFCCFSSSQVIYIAQFGMYIGKQNYFLNGTFLVTFSINLPQSYSYAFSESCAYIHSIASEDANSFPKPDENTDWNGSTCW